MWHELAASVMALQQNPRGPALCRLRPGAILSFAKAVPDRNKYFEEEMDCVQGSTSGEGTESLWSFQIQHPRMGRAGSPPGMRGHSSQEGQQR